MANLNALTGTALEQLLAGGPKGLEDQLYGSAEQDIQRQGQGMLEQLFGRGMGQSSEMGAVARQVAEALAKARTDSAVASRQATLAALAQAAGVQNRQQQESQYERTLGFNKDQADRQESIANKQLLAQGIGGLGGSALTLGGLLYGKELKSGLKGLLGGDSSDLGGVPGGSYISQDVPGGGAPMLDGITQPEIGGDFSIPDFSLNAGQSFDMPDLGALDTGDFSLGFDPSFDLDFGSGLDTSTLDLLTKGWGNYL